MKSMLTRVPRYTFFFKPKQDPLKLKYQQARTLNEKIVVHQQIMESKSTIWDHLLIAKKYQQLGHTDKVDQLIKQMLSSEDPYPQDEINKLLFQSQLHSFAGSFYTSLHHYQQEHKINQQLLQEHCPSYQYLSPQSTQIEVELNIVLQNISNLYKVASLEYQEGNLKQTIEALTQKAEIQDKVCHLLQKIIEEKLSPKKKHMNQDDFKDLMKKILVEQANTFSILIEKLLEGGEKKDTLQVIKLAFNHINTLIQLKLLEESSEIYQRFLINVATVMYHYGFDELLNKELKRIEKLNPKSESVKFDYLYLLQKIEGQKIPELKQCFEQVKMMDSENIIERLQQLRGLQIREMLENEQNMEASDLIEEQLKQNLGVVRRLETLLLGERLEEAEKILEKNEILRHKFGQEYLFVLSKRLIKEQKIDEGIELLKKIDAEESQQLVELLNKKD